MVSSHRLANEDWVDRRIDVIVNDGEIMMGNTSQIVCGACGGASSITNETCECEHNGFYNAPENDVGIIGQPISIVRYKEPTEKFLTLYNAEC